MPRLLQTTTSRRRIPGLKTRPAGRCSLQPFESRNLFSIVDGGWLDVGPNLVIVDMLTDKTYPYSEEMAHRLNQDEAVVANLYHDTMGRSPDLPGYIYWCDQLNMGNVTSGAVASTFLNTTEYRTLRIQQLYQTILGRAAEQSGINYWLGYFSAGHTVEEMKAGFYASDEYFTQHGSTNESLVDAYYQAFLGRQADPGGRAYWSNTLAAGSSRLDVAQSIAGTSQEGAQHVVSNSFSAYLHRAPDAAGLAYWTAQIQSGASEQDLVLGLSSSTEYYERPDLGHFAESVSGFTLVN